MEYGASGLTLASVQCAFLASGSLIRHRYYWERTSFTLSHPPCPRPFSFSPTRRTIISRDEMKRGIAQRAQCGGAGNTVRLPSSIARAHRNLCSARVMIIEKTWMGAGGCAWALFSPLPVVTALPKLQTRQLPSVTRQSSRCMRYGSSKGRRFCMISLDGLGNCRTRR